MASLLGGLTTKNEMTQAEGQKEEGTPKRRPVSPATLEGNLTLLGVETER